VKGTTFQNSRAWNRKEILNSKKRREPEKEKTEKEVKVCEIASREGERHWGDTTNREIATGEGKEKEKGSFKYQTYVHFLGFCDKKEKKGRTQKKEGNSQ